MLLRILAGMILGFLREAGVVNYTKSVMKYHCLRGSLISLGIGLLDLLIIAGLAWERYLDMALGFIVGESIGSYVFIGKKK